MRVEERFECRSIEGEIITVASNVRDVPFLLWLKIKLRPWIPRIRIVLHFSITWPRPAAQKPNWNYA